MIAPSTLDYVIREDRGGWLAFRPGWVASAKTREELCGLVDRDLTERETEYQQRQGAAANN